MMIMTPNQAIAHDPPNVWLTSFYGFTPDTWGLLPFTREGDRKRFLQDSHPGALIVIYGTGPVSFEERGRVLGVMQVSHEVGSSQRFINPPEWQQKQGDDGSRDKWNYGVRAIRAWALAPEDRMPIEQFADLTYTPGRARHIGSRGEKLTSSEALKLLDLDLFEVSVYQGAQIGAFLPEKGEVLFAPSKAGPVSQAPFVTGESEGPKHLYVLKLGGSGEAGHFLGVDDMGDDLVCKVGFSRSPATRCEDHNRHLPKKCAFHWEVLHSTRDDGRAPFDCSDRAKAGERGMIQALLGYGQSLGGEFFRASSGHAEVAFKRGVLEAEDWQSSAENP